MGRIPWTVVWVCWWGMAWARADVPSATELGGAFEARGEPLGVFLPPVVERPSEVTGSSAGVRRLGGRRGVRYLSSDLGPGGLSGKVIYLSPGHGFVHDEHWQTQRENTYGLVEDLANADGVARFLVPYLLNAGAQVVPLREIDFNEQLVILDEGDGRAHPERGEYRESGDPSVFVDSELAGWGHPDLPLRGAVNPFELGRNRLMRAAPSETARASFTLAVPAAGYYYVYIAYSMYQRRASDAEVIVVDAGGATTYLVDQRRQGGTWVLLGRHYFEAGTDTQRGAVIITNRSGDLGANVSLDAVRIGGGLGLVDRGAGVSGQSRADEASRYHAQFSGAPPEVYDALGSDNHDDVVARSRFADWLHAPGEDALFISYHSNAAGGADVRGTQTYVYGANPPDGRLAPADTTLALGSLALAEAVHRNLIADLRKTVDPQWRDWGLLSAFFGELNPRHQDEMPAVLVEAGFHDQKDDAAALKQAGVRRTIARAIYKGVVQYFAQRDGHALTLLPEPPEAVTARNTVDAAGRRRITVSWQAPPSGGAFGDPARRYRLYRSATGRAFDGGVELEGSSWTSEALAPGTLLFLRLTAVNEGGESLPSPTLVVRVGAAEALLVAGFDRIDSELNPRRSYPGVEGEVERLALERINDGSYLVPHARALAAHGLVFDSCHRSAVDGKLVDLARYPLVIWQAGRGATRDRALTVPSRAALAEAAAADASLIVSGSTVARTLAAGSAADRTLLREVFGAGLQGLVERAGEVVPAAEGSLAVLGPWWLAGPDELPYDSGPADALVPLLNRATTAARYDGQKGAIVEQLDGPRCSALIGFPLETVYPAERPTEILGALLARCPLRTDTGKRPTTGEEPGGQLGGSGAVDLPDEGQGGGCALSPGRPGPQLLLLLILGLGRFRRRSRSHRRRRADRRVG